VVRSQWPGASSSLGAEVENAVISRAEDPRKLDGHMPQPADAHNPHPRRRIHAKGAHRVIHRNAAAQQRSRFGSLLEAPRESESQKRALAPHHGPHSRPCRWTQVPSDAGQRFSMPRLHHSHTPQELDCQPRPTRWPTSSSRTSAPTAVTLPTISWPGMNGYWADSPVVRYQVKVAVADTAMANRDLHFL